MSGDVEDRLQYIQQMPEEEWRAFQEAVEARAQGKISKRELLKYIGVGAAAMGGGAMATGSAMADASTSDSDGDVGTPSKPVDVFSDGVASESLEGIQLAEPGELQSRLSSVSADDEVWAVDGAHDPGSETTVPKDVSLRFINAWFEPSGDYNGFYLEHGAKLDVAAITGSSYTSTVVRLNSTDAGGAYRRNDDTHVTVNLEHYGDSNAGTSCLLEATNGAITIGNDIAVSSWEVDRALDMNVGSGEFINGNHLHVTSANCTTGVYHRGDGPAINEITGTIQPGAGSDVGIRNTASSNQSTSFNGQIWDGGAFSTATVEGPGISVVSFGIGPGSLHGEESGDLDQMFVTYADGVNYWEGGDSNYYTIDGGEVLKNDNLAWRFGNSGYAICPAGSYPSESWIGLPRENDPTNIPNIQPSIAWDGTGSGPRILVKDTDGTTHEFLPDGTV